MGDLKPVLSVLRLALRDRLARPGRPRVPEPMLMDDPEAVRAFHESAATVQMPAYEFSASMMSRLVPRGGNVLDLGSGSGQLAAHLATGRPDVRVTCVDLSQEMLATGRLMAAERDLEGRLSFVSGDITSLEDELVGTPDLVCCTYVVHQFPDRDTAVAALREIARIRDEHGSAVWIFDLERLRRPQTMATLFDTMWGPIDRRLREDALASEAAAWTMEEMRDMLAEAGLTELSCARDRTLRLFQSWWAPSRRPTSAPPWERPPISPVAAIWADRTTAGMSNLPPA
jgi:ubiquinone/menaquinone biosynthesis C-methylase UbiE